MNASESCTVYTVRIQYVCNNFYTHVFFARNNNMYVILYTRLALNFHNFSRNENHASHFTRLSSKWYWNVELDWRKAWFWTGIRRNEFVIETIFILQRRYTDFCSSGRAQYHVATFIPEIKSSSVQCHCHTHRIDKANCSETLSGTYSFKICLYLYHENWKIDNTLLVTHKLLYYYSS